MKTIQQYISRVSLTVATALPLLGGVGGSLLFTACDFLDEQPSVSANAPITDASQLIALYDYVTNVQENDYPGAYMTDDTEIPLGLFDAKPTNFAHTNMCFYSLDSEVMEASTNNSLWDGEYGKVFKANTMIENADKVEGSEEEKAEVLANGYFMRAWSMFRMATTYCLPYSEANRDKMGLPLRKGTLFTEDISRKTLGETFDFILEDLKAAEANCKFSEVRADFRWRTSLCAIYGLYSRIYLYMNDYAKALEYANKAVTLAPELMDYNTLKAGMPASYPAQMGMPAQTLEYCETNDWSLVKIYRQYTEWIFIRFQYLGTQWFVPSMDLANSFDQDNDLRFVHFFVEHGNRRMSVAYDYWRYDQFYDCRYNISGLTTAELLLNKAEAMVRTGQWQEGLNVLTALREKRFKSGTATPLTAANQQEALKQVLAERRREMPFASRLMDIKRYAASSETVDDVTIERDFYNVKLTGVEQSNVKHITAKGDDPRLAVPIPALNIEGSQGAIIQNPFK